MAFDLGKELSTQLKTRVFKKVVGGVGDFIRGIPGIGNSSELGKLATRQKSTVDHYSFPIDVESGTETGNHGHYIIFYINEQDHAKIGFGERDASGRGSVIEEVNKRQIPEYIRKATRRTTNPTTQLTADSSLPVQLFDFERVKQDPISQLIQGFDKDPIKRVNDNFEYYTKADKDLVISKGYKKPEFETYNGINVKRAPTKRLKTAISMYMPPDISTSYGAGYSDATIGMFAEQAQDIMKSLSVGFSGKGEAADEALRQGYTGIVNEFIGGGVEQMLTQMLLSTAEVLPGFGGTKEVFGMKTGRVFSPRMEVAFQGLEKRKFNYTFKMTPRSSREAEEIRAIIYAFKHNMLPEIDNDFTHGRRMIVPNTFDISYMYNGSENEFLHKISTCVLENLDVKYGGGKYQTFQGGEGGAPVVETTISLSFKELETITRERAREGF